MINIPGGVFWAMATVVGVILLGLALAYGMLQNRRRNRRNDAVTEAATRDLYDHPDRTPNDASPNPDRRLQPGR